MMLLVNTRVGFCRSRYRNRIGFSYKAYYIVDITHLYGTASFQRQLESVAQSSFSTHAASTTAIIVSLDDAMERIVELEINL